MAVTDGLRNVRYAVRAGLGVLLVLALVFADMGKSYKALATPTLAALSSITCFLVAAQERGRTVIQVLTFALSAPLLMLIGFGLCCLCFVVGGLRWHSWMVCVAASLGVFLLVLWAGVAQARCAPTPLVVAPFWPTPCGLLFCAPMALAISGMSVLALMQATLTACIFVEVGVWVSLLCAHLPCGLVEPPTRELVASAAASRIASLADYREAVALFEEGDPASLARCRQCRFEAIRSTVATKAAVGDAMGEVCGSSWAKSPAVGKLLTSTEAIRFALNLEHAVITHAEFARQRVGPGLQVHERYELQLCTARTLRSAASLAADIAGCPAAEIHLVHTDRGHFGEGHLEPLECAAAAARCRERLQGLVQDWRRALQALPKPTEAAREQQASQPPNPRVEDEDIVVAQLFRSACLQSTEHLAACVAASAAAEVADAAVALSVEASEEQVCSCQLRGSVAVAWVGAKAWFGAPCAGRAAWQQSFEKHGRFALRFALAFGAVFALVVAAGDVFYSGTFPGFWAIITVTLSVAPVSGTMLKNVFQRVLGTLVGAALGIGSMFIAPCNKAVHWIFVFNFAIVMKFLSFWLKGVENVVFVTYLLVLVPSTRVQCDVDGDEANTNVLLDSVEFGMNRIKDVTIGVLMSGLVSFFVAPELAVDTLLQQQVEALRCVASVAQAATVALRHAGELGEGATWDRIHITRFGPSATSEWSDASEHKATLRELRERTWACQEALSFGGDGQRGAKDALAEVSWENRLRSDAGRKVCGGLLWVPDWCRCRRPSARGPRLLATVPVIHRLLRTSHALSSMAEAGFEKGADILLQDRRVVEALGSEQEEGLGTHMQAAVEALDAHLRESDAGGLRAHGAGKAPCGHAQEALSRLGAAKRSFQHLQRGVVAGYCAAGGLLPRQGAPEDSGPGGLRVGAAFTLLDRLLVHLELAIQQLLGAIGEEACGESDDDGEDDDDDDDDESSSGGE